MTDMTNVEFIRDLAARMFRSATPAMGFDQGDTDRLYVIANRLTALEQAGEPVDIHADAQFLIDRLSELEWNDDGYADVMRDFFGHVEPAIGRLKASLRDAALPTLQRLGQEFDAGEEAETLAAMLFESVGDMTWHDPRAEMLVKDEWRQLAKRGLELLHKRFPPQSRGQAFDGELPLKFDPRDAKRWWEENMRESKFVSARLAGDGYVKFQWRDADESGDYSVPWTRIALWLAALSSAKRGEEG